MNTPSKMGIMSLQKRLRLYGRTASKLEIAKEVSNLLIGNPRLKKEPKNISEIAESLGFKERRSVYNYLEIGVDEGFVKKDLNGQYEKPEKSPDAQFKAFSENHPILSDPLVEIWYKKLLARKKNKGITIAKNLLNMIERICNTCKCNPRELIVSKESAERLKTAFIESVKNGEDFKIKKNKRIADIENMDYRASYAIASFCAVHGISWERGTAEMSRKITGHGKYSDARLIDSEFEEADKYLLQKYGLDSDPYRWFWIGVETGSRFKALYGMNLDFYEHTSNTGKISLVFKVYESKTKEIEGGKWKKYVRRSETIESIKILKKKGFNTIFENKEKLTRKAFDTWINGCMKDLYLHLGKDGIFLLRPSHVMKHIACHKLLAKGNYTNHVLVAKVIGSHTVDEMVKSYGAIPPEKVIEELDKYE